MYFRIGRIVGELSSLKSNVREVRLKGGVLAYLGILIALSPVLTQRCAAQLDGNKDSAPAIILGKLPAPIYPPLARTARVIGDVQINLSINADGTIKSATIATGHPLLVQAALDSVKQSRFDCRGCIEGSSNSEIVTYSFRMSAREPDPCCCSSGKPQPDSLLQVSKSGDHIVLTGPPGCICPDECTRASALKHAQFRSVKCLFLWKCGFHNIVLE
jgi:TonB family protein